MHQRACRLLAGLAVLLGSGCTAYRIARYRQPDARDMGMFAKRTVRRAATPFRFSRAAVPRVDIETVTVRREDGKRTPFGQYMEEHAILGFLVVRNDTILYERYAGGLADTTIHNGFSVSKSVLSALIGIALGEGTIHSLDDSITTYLPELRSRSAFDGVTLRHLLGMRSGLRYTPIGRGVWSDFRSDQAHGYYTTNTLGFIEGMPRIEPPGETWRYKDTDAELLGLALARGAHTTVAEYMETRLWRSIGTEHDADWNLDREGGQEKVASGFNAVARDYARFGRLYLNGGEWDGRQVVPAAWVAQSVAIDTVRTEPEISTWWKMQHTLYWWHPIQPPATEFFADGSHGQRIYVDRKSKTIIVQLANQSRQDFPFRKLVAYLNGEPWEYPRSVPALVRQAALTFGVDSMVAVFNRLAEAERRTPSEYVVTRQAFDAVATELLSKETTQAAGARLRTLVDEHYRARP